MKLILTILFSFLCKSVLTQSVIVHGVVIDKNTQQSISNVSVLLDKKQKTVTNSKGKFKLNLNEEEKLNKITFSSLGYKTESVWGRDLMQDGHNVVYLEKLQVTLDEVSVFPKREKIQKKLGPDRNRKVCNVTFSIYPKSIPTQFAILLKSPALSKLDKVAYFIGNGGQPKTKFRVRIYEKDSVSHLPGKELLKDTIFAKAKRGNRWVEVNLQQYNIIVGEKGFYVAMEIIDIGKDGLKFNKYKQTYNKNLPKIRRDTTYGAELLHCQSDEDKVYTTYIKSANEDWFKFSIRYPLIHAYISYYK